ncbi:MAG: SpoIIE family protein phosphatase [Bacteroidales bacterium]|nr:SpoIIE family protein phosphatase [Bacteroidales bacterium]
MKCFWVILLLLFFTAFQAYPQEGELSDPSQLRVDSIRQLIKPGISDSLRTAYYIAIGTVAYNSDTAIKYGKLALEICPSDDSTMLAESHRILGNKYFLKHEPYNAIPHLISASNLFSVTNHRTKITVCCVNLALCYEIINIPDSVYYYLNQSLEISTSINDTSQMAFAYQNLGRKCLDMNLFDDAETYIMKSLELDSIAGDQKALAGDYFWLGILYTHTKNYPKTGHYFKKSIRILEHGGYNESFYATVLHLDYTYLADAYIESAFNTDTTRFADSCLYYIKRGNDFFLKSGQYANYMKDRYAYVKYLLFYKRYNEALQILKDLQPYLTGKDLLREYHKFTTIVYEKLGRYKEAFEQQKLHYQYAMEYLNDSALAAFANFKTDQAVKQKNEEQRQLDMVHTAKTHRMMVIIISLIVCIVLISLLVVFVYRMLKIKRRANAELSQKNLMLDQQKNEILAQRNELTTVHNAVVDSVRYSERIQRAVIPTDEFIKSLFPESFVYYRPRDIVSGDFYYAAKCGKYSVFVVADCTGHGIPGGFLSMLGISSLKEFLVTEQDAANPGTVLDRMRTFFKETLGSTEKNLTPMYDGMDMTICSFDLENNQLIYATANHRVYIIRKDEILKLSGDKMPVGRYFIEKEHFDTFSTTLQSGDMVYLCSDGIQDQTGCPDSEHPFGKKLMTSNFVNILAQMALLKPEAQLAKIDDELLKWRNGFEQIDDITLVGIRI